jgi:hypothetical protein
MRLESWYMSSSLSELCFEPGGPGNLGRCRPDEPRLLWSGQGAWIVADELLSGVWQLIGEVGTGARRDREAQQDLICQLQQSKGETNGRLF